MSWLNLKRLLPSRKVWKLLKNKLPLKMHKLSRSMANKKKPKNISYKTSKKLVWPSSLSIQPKKFKTKPNKPHTWIHHRNRNYKFQKPVFVDHLFVEPVSVVKARVHTPSVTAEKEPSMEKSSSTSDMKKGETSDRSAIDDHNTITADDMWESMVLASPHMHGIDERAEEFIARIKAEMRHQEILARRL